MGTCLWRPYPSLSAEQGVLGQWHGCDLLTCVTLALSVVVIFNDDEGVTLPQVSNANGYLCHIHLESVFRCDPSFLFSIFTNPGKAPEFTFHMIWLLEDLFSSNATCKGRLRILVCAETADNTNIFRDIKEVASRKVLDDSTPGLKIVEVCDSALTGCRALSHPGLHCELQVFWVSKFSCKSRYCMERD